MLNSDISHPQFRNEVFIMMALVTLVTLFSSLAVALPTSSPYSLFSTLAKRQPKPAPTLPASALPPPPASLSLKYITVGVGIQNYTCASPSATPVSIGALASLSDATAIYTDVYNNAPSEVSKDRLASIGTCVSDQIQGDPGLQHIGSHFFTSSGTPTFDLSAGTKSSQYPQGLLLSGKKLEAVLPPADACKGRDGGLAVDWLQLGDDGTGKSRGLKMVYRVETAGGSAASCAGTTPGQVISMDYAANYWFYG